MLKSNVVVEECNAVSIQLVSLKHDTALACVSVNTARLEKFES